MQIVLDITEERYEAIKRKVNNPKREKDEIDIAIANGTPLPKGHGDLIDRSELYVIPIDITDLPTDKCLMVYLAEDVDNAKTIIEADKE